MRSILASETLHLQAGTGHAWLTSHGFYPLGNGAWASRDGDVAALDECLKDWDIIAIVHGASA